jgi:hypothetical protein
MSFAENLALTKAPRERLASFKRLREERRAAPRRAGRKVN